MSTLYPRHVDAGTVVLTQGSAGSVKS